jgi:hypothetical protein
MMYYGLQNERRPPQYHYHRNDEDSSLTFLHLGRIIFRTNETVLNSIEQILERFPETAGRKGIQNNHFKIDTLKNYQEEKACGQATLTPNESSSAL